MNFFDANTEMFFVINNKPFLQTEGHRGYGTAIRYNFYIFNFHSCPPNTRISFANAINRAASRQVLRPASEDSKILLSDSKILKDIIYNSEKKGYAI